MDVALAADGMSARLSGPTVTGLRDLLSWIADTVPGSSGAVTSFVDLEVLEDVEPELQPAVEHEAEAEAEHGTDDAEWDATNSAEAEPGFGHRASSGYEDLTTVDADAVAEERDRAETGYEDEAAADFDQAVEPDVEDAPEFAFAPESEDRNTTEAEVLATAEHQSRYGAGDEATVEDQAAPTYEQSAADDYAPTDEPQAEYGAEHETWPGYEDQPAGEHEQHAPADDENQAPVEYEPHSEHQTDGWGPPPAAARRARALPRPAGRPRGLRTGRARAPDGGRPRGPRVRRTRGRTEQAAEHQISLEPGDEDRTAAGEAEGDPTTGADGQQHRQSTSERLGRLLESWHDWVSTPEGPSAEPPPGTTTLHTPHPLAPPTHETAGAAGAGATLPMPSQHSPPAPIDWSRPAYEEEDEEEEAEVEVEEPRAEWSLEGEAASRRVQRKGAVFVGAGIAAEIVVILFYVLLAGGFTVTRATALEMPQVASAAAPVGASPEPLSPFTGLAAADAVEPSRCWHAVMATWATEPAAVEGAERLGTIGLSGAAISSDLVPDAVGGAYVLTVTAETEEQALEAVGRAAEVGFDGTIVEASPAECSGMSIVPAGGTLGFFDVPTTSPDYPAITWSAAHGLLPSCNPPNDDRFCPDDRAIGVDFSQAAERLGLEVASDDLPSLADAIGFAVPSDILAGAPTRAELARYLWDAAASFDDE